MGQQVSRGQYWAIKNSLTATEKALIDFYELQWMLRHSVPTVEEVIQHINNRYEKEGKHHRTNLIAVNHYLQRAPVVKALDDRGIPWRQHSRQDLTSTQIAAANVMMNFADTRSNEVKLDQLGINPTQYYAWLNDPQFKNLIDSLSDQNLKNIKPTAITEFTKKVQSGHWDAVKYYLDVTGAVESDAPPIEQMMRMVIEVLQRHISDPNVMSAIADDLLRVTNNRRIEYTPPQSQPQAIESYVVPDDDRELEHAKKVLGI